jgi:SIR2-like domain
MESITLAVIVAFLTPYFQKAGEKLTEKTVETLFESRKDIADKFKSLFESEITSLNLSEDTSSEEILKKLETKPGIKEQVIKKLENSESLVNDVREAIKELLKKDPTLTSSDRETLERVLQSSEILKAITESLPKTEQLTHEKVVQKLNRHYRDQNLVLVLGAGVSMSFGLPGWDILLQKLMITTIEKEPDVSTVLSKLFTNVFAPNPLIAGRYLQEYYDERNQSFELAVRDVLYKELDINKTSALMDEIINYCVAPANSPKLDSVISYNYDDILEQRLSRVGVSIPYKSIYGIGMSTNGQLPVFHVHGFLPQTGNLSEDNQITFGESIYHKQYTDIYSWNNIVQINKFRDFNCLFIGSSLTDPNTRRLLDIARRQKGHKEQYHYIFKKRYGKVFVEEHLARLLKENEELLNEKSLAQMDFNKTVNLLIDIIQRFEEKDMASFGVKTIWIDDWDEIPKMLKVIRTYTE